jgi:iron(III) transport system permease protein
MQNRALRTTVSLVFILAIAAPLIAVAWLGMAAFADPSALSWMAQTVLPIYLFNSVLLCLGSLAVAWILGLPAAWFLSQYEFRGRVALEWAMILPMALPAYVVAYAYTDALDFSGWLAQWFQMLALWVGLSARDFQAIWPEIRSLPGAIFVLGVALSPYVALLAKTAFEDRQVNLSEAARSLGLSPAGAFYRVVLPLARPALVAGSALVIMECLADYGTVSFFSVQTLSTGLFKTWFGYGDRSAAALMGLGMLGLAVLILAWERVVRGRAGFTGRPGQARPRLPLQGKARFWVPLVCGLGGLFGFVLPVLLLLVAGLSSAEPIAVNGLIRQTLQTAFYGVYALAVILPMAIVLAYGQRSMQGGWLAKGLQLASSGYAVPGLVVALGLLGWSAFFTQTAMSLFDWRVTLTATSVLLIGGYLTRFFTVGYSSVEVGLGRLTNSLDWSARSLGLSAQQVVFRVHWPVLRGSAAVAGLLVFVDVVKELPLTLVLRPMNVETLATAAHQFAADERLAQAAWPSLTIALVGLIPLLVLGPRLRA